MKLRIKGNSLRLRVTRSELTRLLETGRIDETIHFSATEDSRLTYALEYSEAVARTQLASRPQEVAVILPEVLAQGWAQGSEVGIYERIDLGPHGTLDLAVEKDFACLDLSDEENADTFPNPHLAGAC